MTFEQVMAKGDYDGRTALHLAVCEGHVEVVSFLLRSGCFPDIEVLDRWGNSPMDDAINGQRE